MSKLNVYKEKHNIAVFDLWKEKIVFHAYRMFCLLDTIEKKPLLHIWLQSSRSVFSLGPLVSSTNKTDHHDITEILLKVALNKHHQTKPSQSKPRNWFIQNNCNWHLNEIAQFCILFWWNLPWNAIWVDYKESDFCMLSNVFLDIS